MAFGYPGTTLGQRLRKLRRPAGNGLADQLDGLSQPGPAQGTRTPGHLQPRQIATRTANQGFRRQQQLYGQYVLPELNRLRDQANTNQFDDTHRAAYLAPSLDALNTQMHGAEGDLSRQLAERGLGSSSAMTSGLGALAGAGATARAGLINDLYQTEDQRQQQAQSDLRGYAGGLFSGQQQTAASLATQLEQLRLQEEAQNQQDGGFLGDLAGGLGGILGGIGGLGGLGGLLGRRKPGVRNALVE